MVRYVEKGESETDVVCLKFWRRIAAIRSGMEWS
jgi:hypothetical protein